MTGLSETSFNLIDRPWIPVLEASGQTRLVSLDEAFVRAGEIRDLACGPAERISVLRLLICIAQASQDVPQRDDSPDWTEFSENMVSASVAYLARTEIKAGFELFGNERRFLQFPTTKAETMASSKLFLHLASGGNPTHNDHGGGEPRAMEAYDLALALLTFQNFSPLLGRGFTGRGLCVENNAAHAFQCRANLAATISANCLSLDAITSIRPDAGIGRPVWENPPIPPFDSKTEATKNATFSYLGRLVPIARLVWIADPANVVIANGPSFPDTDQVREPSTTVRPIQPDNTYAILPLRLGRAVWRDLPAFTLARQNEGCPVMRRSPNSDREIFVGGLITDFKAKIEDSQASEFSGQIAVPSRMFGDAAAAQDARNDYYAAMTAAEAWEKSLWIALGSYFSKLKVDPKQASDIRARAQASYWSFLEHSLPDLFTILRSGEYPDEPLDHPYAKSSWHSAIRDSASRAYRLHAQRGNARQLEAFALGLKAIWPKNPTKSTAA